MKPEKSKSRPTHKMQTGKLYPLAKRSNMKACHLSRALGRKEKKNNLRSLISRFELCRSMWSKFILPV